MHASPDAPLTPLFQTRNGYVLWCDCCGRLQLVFGNAVLTQDIRGIELFRRLVDCLDLATPSFVLPTGRGYAVTLNDVRQAFAFTHDEVLELRELLAGTFAMLNLKRLLEQALTPGKR
jgi:hypothetical protein